MAESKRIFNAGKMNRDLDDRLIPAGQYRDALNIGVGRSEGSDVGAVENLKGNHDAIQGVTIPEGVTIGNIRDPHTDKIYWFNVEGVGTIDETSSIYEFDESTGLTRLVLRDKNTRDAPPPVCEPDISTRITDGNSIFGIAPDFPDFPRLPLAACLDATAANTETGSGRYYHDQSLCTYVIPGCTDPDANNYNPGANMDNGSCVYPSGPDYGIGDAMVSCSVSNAGVVTVVFGDTTLVGSTFAAIGAAADGTYPAVSTDTTRYINVTYTVPTTLDPGTGRPIYGNSGQTLTDQCSAVQGYTATGNIWSLTFVNGSAPANTTVSGGGMISGLEGSTITHDPDHATNPVVLPSFTITEKPGFIFASGDLPDNRFSFVQTSGVTFTTTSINVGSGPFDVASQRVQIESITFEPNIALDQDATIEARWALQAGDLLEFTGFNANSAGATCSLENVVFEGDTVTGFITAGTLVSATVTSGSTTLTPTIVGNTFSVVIPDRSPEIPSLFEDPIAAKDWTVVFTVTVPTVDSDGNPYGNAGQTVTPTCTIEQAGKQPAVIQVKFTSIVPDNIEHLGVQGGQTLTGNPGSTHAGPYTFKIGPSDGYELSAIGMGSVSFVDPDGDSDTVETPTATYTMTAADNELTITDVVLGTVNEDYEITWAGITADEVMSNDTTLTVNITAPANSNVGEKDFLGAVISDSGSSISTQTFTFPAGDTGDFGFGRSVSPDPPGDYVPNPGFIETNGNLFGQVPISYTATGGWSDWEPFSIFGDATNVTFISAVEWPATDGTISISWPTSNVQPAPPEATGFMYYVWTNGLTPTPPKVPGQPHNDHVFCSCGIRTGPDGTGFYTPGVGSGSFMGFIGGVDYAFTSFTADNQSILSVFTVAGDHHAAYGTPHFDTAIGINLQPPSRRQRIIDDSVIEPVLDNNGNHATVRLSNGGQGPTPESIGLQAFGSGTLKGGYLSGSAFTSSPTADISLWPYSTPI